MINFRPTPQVLLCSLAHQKLLVLVNMRSHLQHLGEKLKRSCSSTTSLHLHHTNSYSTRHPLAPHCWPSWAEGCSKSNQLLHLTENLLPPRRVVCFGTILSLHVFLSALEHSAVNTWIWTNSSFMNEACIALIYIVRSFYSLLLLYFCYVHTKKDLKFNF